MHPYSKIGLMNAKYIRFNDVLLNVYFKALSISTGLAVLFTIVNRCFFSKTRYYSTQVLYALLIAWSWKTNTVSSRLLRYIDTVFLGRQNHDNQINAKFEKNLVHYIEFGCLLLNE